MRLAQTEVAEILGVKQMTLSYWERDKFTPQTGYLPNIVQFLGYVPWQIAESLGSKLQQARLLKGLDSAELAAQLDVSTKAILRWESNINKPRPAQLAKLNVALGTTL